MQLSLNNILKSKRITIILSIILAVIFWFVVVLYFDPESNKMVSDVPVTISTNNSQVERMGLEVTKMDPPAVSLDVSGKRYKIGAMDADDFTVTVSLATVTAADTYVLDLVAAPKVQDNDYSVTNVTPHRVSVTFDSIASKTFTLTAAAPNMKAENDYILESPVASPEYLEVKGPEQEMSRLSSVVLFNDQFLNLTASQTVDAEPKFYAEDGSELDASLFRYKEDVQFKITLPVYKQKTLPLTFKYKNAPNTLDTSQLQYTISPSEITVIAPVDAIHNLNEINLGYVDLRELDLGKSFQFNIPFPAAFRSVDNITQATVTFSQENWSSKILSVNDIRMMNQPYDYDVQMRTQAIRDVKIVGFTSMIEQLTVSDLVATMDLSNQTLQEGTQTLPIAIEIVSKDGIWAVGEYTCVINVVGK